MSIMTLQIGRIFENTFTHRDTGDISRGYYENFIPWNANVGEIIRLRIRIVHGPTDVLINEQGTATAHFTISDRAIALSHGSELFEV